MEIEQEKAFISRVYNNMQIGKIKIENGEFDKAYKYLQMAWSVAITISVKEIKTIADLLQQVYCWKLREAKLKGKHVHVSR